MNNINLYDLAGFIHYSENLYISYDYKDGEKIIYEGKYKNLHKEINISYLKNFEIVDISNGIVNKETGETCLYLRVKEIGK